MKKIGNKMTNIGNKLTNMTEEPIRGKTKLDRFTRLAAHTFNARRAWLVLEDGSHQFASHRTADASGKEIMRHAPIYSAQEHLLGSLWVIVPSAGSQSWTGGHQKMLELFAEMLATPLERYLGRQTNNQTETTLSEQLRGIYRAIVVYDKDKKIVNANSAALSLWSVNIENMRGSNLEDWILDVPSLGVLEGEHRFNVPTSLRVYRDKKLIVLDGVLAQLEMRGQVCNCVCLRERPNTTLNLESYDFVAGWQLQSYVQTTDLALIHWDLRGRVLFWNPAAEALFNYMADEVIGQSLFDLVMINSNSGRDQMDLLHQKMLENKKHLFINMSNRTKSGRRLMCRWESTPLTDFDSHVTSVISLVRDITFEAEADDQLRLSKARNQALREAIPDVIFTLSRGGMFLDYQQAPSVYPYFGESQMLGRRLEEMASPELFALYREALDVAFTKGKSSFEHTLERGGQRQYHEARVARYGTDEAVVIVRDMTQQKRAELDLQHLAFHDGLTDLPNRALFARCFEQALEDALKTYRPFSLAFIDLNHFKQVNDTLGHAYGDILLKQVADQLRRVLRDGDTLARMGGDEFTLILPGMGAVAATEVATQIVERLSIPFDLGGGHMAQIGASVGLSTFPDDGVDGQELLRKADHKMYEIKNARKENSRQ